MVVVVAAVPTAVMIVVMVMVIAMVAAAAVHVLPDAVPAYRSKVVDVEAQVGAEALGLQLVLQAVVVSRKVDATEACKVGNGAADAPTLLRRVVEVKVDATGAGHDDQGRHRQESALHVHVEWVSVDGIKCLVVVVVDGREEDCLVTVKGW